MPTLPPSDHCFDILPDDPVIYGDDWTTQVKTAFDKLEPSSINDFINNVVKPGMSDGNIDKYRSTQSTGVTTSKTPPFDYGIYSKAVLMRTKTKNIEECRKIANQHNYNYFKFGSRFKFCLLHNFHPSHLEILKTKLEKITKPTGWVHGIINTNNKLSDISDICRNYVDKTQSSVTGMISQKIVPHNDTDKDNWIYKF